MFDKQETFDTVAKHLLTQGRKSLDVDGGCRYLAPGGERCAAGCLIPDDEYDSTFEGMQVWGVARRRKWADWFGHDVALVIKLQRVHDNFATEDWPDEIRAVASFYGLCANVIQDFEEGKCS